MIKKNSELKYPGKFFPFVQNGSKLKIDLSDELQGRLAPVLKMECDSPAGVYRTDGLRIANVEHPRYDPIQPDIQY